MRFLYRFLLLALVLTGTSVVFSSGSNLQAFAPKLEFHLNEEKLKEDYERAARAEAEARKYDQEQKERQQREEIEKREREERAREEQRRCEERAKESRDRAKELFPR